MQRTTILSLNKRSSSQAEVELIELPPTNDSIAAERFNEALRQYSPAISKAGTGLISAMSSFVAWKYFNATPTNPFKQHGVVLAILITATLVHLIFGYLMRYFIHSLILTFGIFLISGVIAIELLLYVLFTQIWKLLAINVSVALLMAMVCFSKMLASFLWSKWLGSRRDQPQDADGGDIEMMEVDEPPH